VTGVQTCALPILDFDVETVWDKYWLPFLRDYFDGA